MRFDHTEDEAILLDILAYQYARYVEAVANVREQAWNIRHAKRSYDPQMHRQHKAARNEHAYACNLVTAMLLNRNLTTSQLMAGINQRQSRVKPMMLRAEEYREQGGWIPSNVENLVQAYPDWGQVKNPVNQDRFKILAKIRFLRDRQKRDREAMGKPRGATIYDQDIRDAIVQAHNLGINEASIVRAYGAASRNIIRKAVEDYEAYQNYKKEYAS